MKRNPNTKCSVCYFEIYRTPKDLARFVSVYCSRKCYGLGQRKRKLCPVCNNFSGYGQTFCSVACSNTARTGIKYKTGQQYNKAHKHRSNKQAVIDRDGEYCLLCGLDSTWRGKRLVLQLDHIDGNHSNNDMNNLRLLCPNCHSQTDTYGSKNKGRLTESGIVSVSKTEA